MKGLNENDGLLSDTVSAGVALSLLPKGDRCDWSIRHSVTMTALAFAASFFHCGFTYIVLQLATMDKNYVPLREAKKVTGLCGNTLRKYADTGVIPHYRLPCGNRMFDISSFITETNAKNNLPAV